MISAGRVIGGKGLNATWQREPERVNALIVVTCHKSRRPAINNGCNEFQVHWVQILVLIHNQLGNSDKVLRDYYAGSNLLNTFANNFTGQYAGIDLLEANEKLR